MLSDSRGFRVRTRVVIDQSVGCAFDVFVVGLSAFVRSSGMARNVVLIASSVNREISRGLAVSILWPFRGWVVSLLLAMGRLVGWS